MTHTKDILLKKMKSSLYVTFNITHPVSKTRSWLFLTFSRDGRFVGNAKENAPHGISI